MTSLCIPFYLVVAKTVLLHLNVHFTPQTDFHSRFIPLSDPILPDSDIVIAMDYDSLAQIHDKENEFNSQNFSMLQSLLKLN